MAEQVAHPQDYARDVNGKVPRQEFNRWLPWYRCTDCGMWLNGPQIHTVETCERFKAVRGG